MATSVGTTPVQYGTAADDVRPEVLIERWLPVDVLGAESMRERGASSALPPLYFLHVWWARRPLTASRAAILASVLPVWRADWPQHLKTRFPNEQAYTDWFKELCGIFGDPVAGRKLIAWARERDIKLKGGPYTHKRAFTVSPSDEYLQVMRELLEATWGTREISILDCFAGGGSIPFESLRYGFKTFVNELNPVASVVLRATLDLPSRFGLSLVDDIILYGRRLSDAVKSQLQDYFPVERSESVHAYIWAHAVACPYTGKPIPLSPNWWLRKGGEPFAVKVEYRADAAEPVFTIVRGKEACAAAHPDTGTVTRGNAVSGWASGQIVSGDYIKAEAQAGRLSFILYAVAVKGPNGLEFRAPNVHDTDAAERARAALDANLPRWQGADIVPSEEIPPGYTTKQPHRYGMTRFRDMFAPRQLLALCTASEELVRLRADLFKEMAPDRALAVLTYLALALDKAADYNSRLTKWDGSRSKVTNTFDTHDFGFKWSHAEFDAARNLLPWVVSQVADAYRGIAKLRNGEASLGQGVSQNLPTITRGLAAQQPTLASGSITAVVVDPPYYDMVMYGESSDFFYVWLKRNLRGEYADILGDELTNKDDEAVANSARFEVAGKKKTELARADYERKMAASFREMFRVLRDDGVLTVMFTHKEVAAWDTLATSLISAGFAIHSSLPTHTESENSLQQAKKNSAKSTILLSCRKRLRQNEPVWWDDLKGRVRQVAREKAREFEAQGIRGVDLYIATFGPTLAILSENWPVLTSEVDRRTGEPKPLRPEVALELARQEVVNLRKQGLLLGRTVQFDAYTDWYLMAWDAFRAEEFPADEARKLAIALGLDLERQVITEKRLVAKKSSSVVLQKPSSRRGTTRVDADRDAFDHIVDAVHTAMWIFEEDGAAACEAFLRGTGLRADAAFKACLQAMLNAIPRTKQKGRFVRPEAEVLEGMRLAFFDDLAVPVDAEPRVVEEQLQLLGGVGAPEASEMGEGEEEDEGEVDE